MAEGRRRFSHAIVPKGSSPYYRDRRFSLLIRMSLRTHGRELFPSHCSIGSNSRDEEKTVLKELVPMLACLNSSGAGVSLF